VNTIRFTIDGSAELEDKLAQLCTGIGQAVAASVPKKRIDGLVLGGGYGRGEGGVLRTPSGDQPYNDIEFYLFLEGPRLLNQRRHGAGIRKIEEAFSKATGVHVEIKIDSLSRLRRETPSMFSYDLLSAHRIISGPENVFDGCSRHELAASIPISEATRLLFNRCSGLLLVREILEKKSLSAGNSDFVGRNLAKASLCFGDAVLTALGKYHWSCLERDRRLQALARDNSTPHFAAILELHSYGVDFKLHPKRIVKAPEAFAAEHDRLSKIASDLWLWIEGQRLGRPFDSVADYSMYPANKCAETSPLRNYLLNLRSFGTRCALAVTSTRYPRERLFNSLPLLLWEGETGRSESLISHLQHQLQTSATDWQGFVGAYKKLWAGYG
jgi:hypothetical protein